MRSFPLLNGVHEVGASNPPAPTIFTYEYGITDKLAKEIEGQTMTAYSYYANGSLTKKDNGADIFTDAHNYDDIMSSGD